MIADGVKEEKDKQGLDLMSIKVGGEKLGFYSKCSKSSAEFEVWVT